MRNYTYHGLVYIELYEIDNLTKINVTTITYGGKTESHRMWTTKRQFEAALDGDQDTRRAIELAYTDLLNAGNI